MTSLELEQELKSYDIKMAGAIKQLKDETLTGEEDESVEVRVRARVICRLRMARWMLCGNWDDLCTIEGLQMEDRMLDLHCQLAE